MLWVTTAHNLVVQESKEVKNIGGLGVQLSIFPWKALLKLDFCKKDKKIHYI